MGRELRRAGLSDDFTFAAMRKDAPPKVVRLQYAMMSCLFGAVLLWVLLFGACS